MNYNIQITLKSSSSKVILGYSRSPSSFPSHFYVILDPYPIWFPENVANPLFFCGFLLESASGFVMDEVVQEVEKVKREWYETYSKTQEHVKAIGEYGKSGKSEEKSSLPRLNGIAQDGLALLSSLQFRLDLLAPQLPTDEEVESAITVLESWKTQSQSLRLSLRNANLQAKENMRKAAQEEAI